jgi:hypothetical protein
MLAFCIDYLDFSTLWVPGRCYTGTGAYVDR